MALPKSVAVLLEQESPTDEALFGGKRYNEFCMRTAQDMISGVCHYLRRLGFRISEDEEEERAKTLSTFVKYEDSDETASTTSAPALYRRHKTETHHITVNAGCSALSTGPNPLSRELRHYAVQGLLVHEVGHVIFTDFPTKRVWQNELLAGKWWPEEPKRFSDAACEELKAKMQDRGFLRVFTRVAHELDNFVEDGYIEAEMQALYGGLATTELATMNDLLFCATSSFGEDLKAGMHPFLAVQKQTLLYACFDYMENEDAPSEYLQLFDDLAEIIDDAKYQRDPKKRAAAINEILCLLWPLLRNFIYGDEDENKEEQEGQEENEEGQEENGNGAGAGTGNKPLDESHIKTVEAALERLESTVKMTTEDENATSSGLASKPNVSEQQSVVSHAPKNEGDQDCGEKTGEGECDLTAAECQLSSLVNTMKQDAAEEKAEENLAEVLQQEANEIKTSDGFVQVERAASVSESNIEAYKTLSLQGVPIARNLERRLKPLIRDEEYDGRVSGLLMGACIESRRLYHQDGKYFAQNNAAQEAPRLVVGYLCDESGSMSQSGLDASIRAGIVLERFCRGMELPCFIGGFTSSGRGPCAYLSYVEPCSVDKNDCYRLTGMSSRGGTPTVPAMEYLASRMEKERGLHKLLIVSTDGGSDQGPRLMREAISKIEKKGIVVVGAGIGSARDAIQREFGKNFLDISNVEELPVMLTKVVRQNIWK